MTVEASLPGLANRTLTIVICINNNIHWKCRRARLVWDGVIPQACVDHVDYNYLWYRSVDWRLFGTIFKQIRAQKRAAPGCFGFTGAKGCCDGSSHEFCGKFNLAVVRGSETQTTEKRTWNCSCITITKYYQWSSWRNERSWRFSHCITIPRNHELMRTFCLKGIIVVLSFLKAGFNKRKSSAVLPTWLLQCEQTLLDWSSVCEKKKHSL